MKVIGMEARRKRGEYVMGGDMELDLNKISRRVVSGKCRKFLVHSDQAHADDTALMVMMKGGVTVGTIDPQVDPGEYQWGLAGDHVQIFFIDEQGDQYAGSLIGALIRAGAGSVSICAQQGLEPNQ